MGYRTLDPARIIATAERLETRIGERFPDSGLRRVARELVSLAGKAEDRLKPGWRVDAAFDPL